MGQSPEPGVTGAGCERVSAWVTQEASSKSRRARTGADIPSVIRIARDGIRSLTGTLNLGRRPGPKDPHRPGDSREVPHYVPVCGNAPGRKPGNFAGVLFG